MAYVVTPPTRATHRTPAECSPGMVAVATVIAERWPRLLVNEGPYGCFNRRPITGGTAPSLHGDGLALDVGVGHGRPTELVDDMAELVWRLTAGCYSIGVQRQLYNRHAWTADRGWRRSSSMGGPHLDHLHLELCRSAGWAHPVSIEVVRCALA